MKELLAREDLPEDEKFKLYSQALKRYLFLQRQSGNVLPKGQIAPPVLHIDPPSTQVSSTATSRSPSPTPSAASEASGESGGSTSPGATSTPKIKRELKSIPRNTFSKESIVNRIPRYRTNLPRNTPKEEILRRSHEMRKNQRYNDFFLNWVTP